MKNSSVRIFQRYLVPRFAVSAYYYLRFGCLVSTKARVQLTPRIRLGRGTVVKDFAIVQTSNAVISFGKNCAISSFSHVSAGSKEVTVGDNVRMGPNVVIVAVTRNFKSAQVPVVEQGHSDRGIRIGNDVFVGAGAIILDGCTIGDGAVIGAGCLVNRDVAPYRIVAGVPARDVGARGPQPGRTG